MLCCGLRVRQNSISTDIKLRAALAAEATGEPTLIERRRIVDLHHQNQTLALATLVRVEGSSYRQPGAQILIAANGAHAGSLSGGCLEAEIVRKAPWLIRNGPVIQRYSTLFDDTADIPYGLGCGGTVDVLLELTHTPECQALLQALADSLQGHTRLIHTTLNPLHRHITDPHGNTLFRSPGAPTPNLNPDPDQTFTQRLDPPQRLFICGAGDDARPLVQMAALLGWTVHLLDTRLHLATPTRFPEAHAITATLPAITPDDAVVLMTHSYEADRNWLTQILPATPRYLGLLGSRHRSALLVAEAAQHLNWPLHQACERLFAPVGLDLGGDGAESIALSITAEIQACLQGKLPASRRLTPDSITRQIATGGPSRYLTTQCAL